MILVNFFGVMCKSTGKGLGAVTAFAVLQAATTSANRQA